MKWGWNVADNSPCSFCLDGVFNYVQFARRFGLYIAKKYNYYFYRICVEGVVHNTVHEEDKNYIYIYYRISVEGVVYNSVHEVDKNLNYEFIWNKRDAYGRKVYGQVKHFFRNIHYNQTLIMDQLVINTAIPIFVNLNIPRYITLYIVNLNAPIINYQSLYCD